MKKVLSIIALSGIFAVTTPLASQAVTQVNQERGFITVSTTANTEIVPDVAEIAFAVKTSDEKSMQTASIKNQKITDKLYATLSVMLNTKDGDFVKTSDYSAMPVYSYSNSKKNFERYEVSNRVIVHIKSVDKVGSIIDKAIAAGATNVDNLTFSVSNYDNECDDLLGIATKKAQKRAGVLSKNLSTSLDGVKTISGSCNSNNHNNVRMYMAKNIMSSVASDASGVETSTKIDNGVVKIYANVNASFFVK